MNFPKLNDYEMNLDTSMGECRVHAEEMFDWSTCADSKRKEEKW
jgi:hypothetical protein